MDPLIVSLMAKLPEAAKQAAERYKKSVHVPAALAMRMVVERSATENGDLDYLSVVAIVKRRGQSAIALHDFQFRLSYETVDGAGSQKSTQAELAVERGPKSRSEPATMAELSTSAQHHSTGTAKEIVVARLNRLTFCGLKEYREAKKGEKKPLKLLWEPSGTVPWLNLAAGDEMEVAGVFVVDAHRPCLIEAAALGMTELGLGERILRFRWQRELTSEWRSSAVSLPRPPRTAPQV